MTPQEAIEFFKGELEGGKCSEHCVQCNANELALQALEKQIPKKAKNITTTLYYKQGRCPNCNALLKNTMNIFCSDCGQALDWSEDVE